MKKTGLAVSAGAALAPAWRYPGDLHPGRAVCGATPQRRLDDYRSARDEAKGELERLAAGYEAGDPRGELLLAQCALLDDPMLTEEMAAAVEHLPTSEAVERVYRSCADLLRGLNDPVIRERSADYLDLGRRIGRILAGRPEEDWSRMDRPCILVAEELPPSAAASLDRTYVKGIVTERGGMTCHTAIMARSCGIPAVLGVADLMEKVQAGDEIALEAQETGEGTVWICPDAEIRTQILAAAEREATQWQEQADWLARPGKTRDGVPVSVLLNLAAGDEKELAFASLADGVGLFRTEFLYLDREIPPSEEEQYQCYRRVLETFGDRPVTLRTMDFGGDKIPRCLPRMGEDDLRGVGLSLRCPDLFRTQLRAALRAANHGRLRLMLPMVTDLEEVVQVRALLRSVEEELCEVGCPAGRYELGVMIEVPELARESQTVARAVDFASLGTNDLCQYLLGADRNRPDRAEEHLSCHPELLALIVRVAEAFGTEGKDLSLCGELAGDLPAVPLLVGLGLRKLSVAPGRAAAVKERLASVTLEQANRLAEGALTRNTGMQVREDLLRAYEEAKDHV